jgi:hypothetical protein
MGVSQMWTSVNKDYLMKGWIYFKITDVPGATVFLSIGVCPQDPLNALN